MPITADTPATAGSAPTDPAPTSTPTPTPTLPTPTLPAPDPARVERALDAVLGVYRRADARTRRWWEQSITFQLAAEVLRRRAVDEQLAARAAGHALDERPAADLLDHALAAARDADRHPSGSNLRVLAAEVEHAHVEQAVELERFAWLVRDLMAVDETWRGLTYAQRGDVPGVLVDVVDRLRRHLDGTSRAERELARLRAVEAAARGFRATWNDPDGLDTAFDVLCAALDGDI